MQICNIILNELLNIIHLSRRTDRKNSFEQQLAMQNISNFRIWEGIEDPLIPWRGISMAHKQIVRHAQVIGQERVLIAEDDIIFTDKGAFDYFMANVPPVFDLYLGSIYEGKIDNSLTVAFTGLTLYIISNRFYNTFLNVPEHVHLDRGLAGIGQFFVCVPFTAVQSDGYSDNLKKYCSLQPYMKGMPMFTAKNLSDGRKSL
jgi:hypothetical protein